MEENLLLNKMRENQVVLGYANSIAHPGVIEACGKEWDFVWMCSQHGFYDYNSTYTGILAAERNGVAPLVRVPGHDQAYLSRIMDLAPAAVMIPFVNNAAEARDLVDAACFPPLGKRSFIGARVLSLYGGAGAAKKRTLVIAQIETEEAVRNAEEIINTPGIDMLFYSADDMRLSGGLSLDVPVDESPVLLESMRSVAAACKKAGKLAGIVAVTDTLMKLAVEAGYTLVVPTSDVALLFEGRQLAVCKRGTAQKYFNEVK